MSLTICFILFSILTASCVFQHFWHFLCVVLPFKLPFYNLFSQKSKSFRHLWEQVTADLESWSPPKPDWGPVHTTWEKFEIGVFTLKTHQIFSVHTTPEKFENATINCHFGFVFEENLGQGNHMIIVTSSFSKSFVFKMFSVHTKTQSRRFQIPPVWKAFSKSSVIVTDYCGRYA